MTRWRKWTLLAAGVAAALALLLAAAGVAVVRSDWFREKLRLRMIAEAERATGGRVELGSYAFDPWRLTARVDRFLLRGTEGPQEPPLFEAGSIEVGLRVVSAFRRDIDLASIVVRNPRIHIIVYPDNSTNFPSPARRGPRRDAMDFILKLAVRRFTIENGLLRFAARRIPIDTRGENLVVRFIYDAAGPRYRGQVAAGRLSVQAPGIRPAVFGFSCNVDLEHGRIAVAEARFSHGRSLISASGAIENFQDPRARFDTRARLQLEDAARWVDLPVERRGSVSFEGVAALGGSPPFSLHGTLNGQGLALEKAGVRVAGARAAARISLDPRGVRLDGLTLRALDGVFAGRARIDDWKRFALSGDARGYSLQALAAARAGAPSIAWSGAVSGPVQLRGRIARGGIEGVELDATLAVAPGEGPRPIEGTLGLAYHQDSGTIEFGASRLAARSTSVDFHGVLGRVLEVRLETRDLDDLLPGIALFSGAPPEALPLGLRRGTALFEGEITGPLESPRIHGCVRLAGAVYEGRLIDRLSARFSLDRSALAVTALAVEHQGLTLQGRGRISLVNWRPSGASAIEASGALRDARLGALLAANGRDLPVEGVLAASLEANGTLDHPGATAAITVEKPSIYGERFDRLRARVLYRDGTIEAPEAVLEAGPASLRLAASYTHPPGDWREGTLSFKAGAGGLPLGLIPHWNDSAPGLSGAADFELNGLAWIRKGEIRLATLDGHAALKDLKLDKQPLGHLALKAAGAGGRLRLAVSGELRGAAVNGGGEWELAGRYPGQGELTFGPVRFAELQALFRPGKPLPFAGFVSGKASLSVPLAAPGELRGEVRLEEFRLWPQDPGAGPQAAVRRELVLENAGQVLLGFDAKGVQVRQARFAAAQTKLGVDGSFAFQSRNPWNLRFEGEVNFALLRAFYPKLVPQGQAVLNAAVRGALARPQLNGRMELRDASLFLDGYPLGVSNAKGLVLFDRDRATIEKMTAELGGGELSLGGFVGFGGETTVFRLQAEAERARVRYPEGTSTTANASLSLSGTAERSIITGTVTVERAAFTPRTDLASLLLAGDKPLGAPAVPNPILSSMQLDVRVDSSPGLQFQTALARDLQTELDLRLRGTLAKPVVLGNVLVSQGEIQFFGNRYRINRGEVGFFNPARIEPVLDLDLETRVRGITVTLNFSGSINKLSMTYRSDPPLQPEEIVALLAVGRAPMSGLAASQTIAGQNSGFQTGANTLLGQALAAPLTGRLQRFFGVSRLKIDPQLTGVDTTPQARLTIEQQISPDITLTYVTNLSEAKQQIVRLEWDLSKQWSVAAIRDENGVFAIDFLYKKRF